MEQVDPALSQILHEINGKGIRKPFTVSPLMGLPKPKGKGDLFLREGWECWLRMTLLDDALFKPFISYFAEAHQTRLPEVRLGDSHFIVREILNTPGSHPWAGYCSVEELQKKVDAPPQEKFLFELHTPTSFRLSKGFATMPTPKLVFGSLAGAWRTITGENNVEAVEKYAEQNFVMGNYKLHTERSILHNNSQVGSVGRFEFIRTDATDHPIARSLNLLAELAFFAGLGRKTPQGMGMARRMSEYP